MTEEDENYITRRNLLKKTGAAAGFGVAATALSGDQEQEEKRYKPGLEEAEIYETLSTGDYPFKTDTLTVEEPEDEKTGAENPFFQNTGEPLPREEVIDKVVDWNLDGKIGETNYKRNEIINFVVEWNLE